MTAPIGTAPTVDSRTLRRVIVASTVGVFVEFFDSGLYGFYAGAIASTFFPEGNPTVQLLSAFSVYALTFLIRPVGGFVSGFFGDRFGRRAVMVFSIISMSLATGLIGILPGYASIGLAAPILLIVLRLIQGFAAGGEAPVAQTFIAEYAPDGRRGFLCSFGQWGGVGALLAATLLSAILGRTVGPEAMNGIGWRVLFLLAIPLGVIGLYIRTQLNETPAFVQLARKAELARNPIKALFATKATRRALVIAFLLPAVNGSGYYVLFNYMPTYLTNTLHFASTTGYAVTAVAVLATVIFIPVAGRLSDRWGRKRLLAGSAILIGILAFPCYALLTRGSVGLAILAAVLLAISFAGHSGTVILTLVEMFPTTVRFASVGLGYNVSTAIFGGTAPFLVTWLGSSTGFTAVPAAFIVLTAIVTLITVFSCAESARQPLRHE